MGKIITIKKKNSIHTVPVFYYVIFSKIINYLFVVAILGFHSMMNQDQYHASLLNKGQPVGLGWDGITKASKPKIFPMDPPNNTDVEDSIRRVQNDDPKYIDLNWNNIKVCNFF